MKPIGNDGYIKQCLLFVAHSPVAAQAATRTQIDDMPTLFGHGAEHGKS